MSNTLYDALIAIHADNDHVFLTGDDGVQMTYAAFVQRCAQIANALVGAGLQAGDRVLVQAPKLPETICLYAASLQAGGVFVPLNTAYTQEELAYFIADADPAIIVCDAANETAIRALAKGRQGTVLTLADKCGSLSMGADTQPTVFPTAPRGPDDLAALLYTSGTTGRSKGAMLSHKNLLANATALAALWQITHTDRLVHALPVFHSHGLFVAMNTSLLAGAAVRFMARFDLDALLAELPNATLLMGVPTFYTRLLADDRFDKALTRNMRLFVSGSAPLLAETHTAFEARTGHRILERYGMTETNMITSNPYQGDRIAGTVGFALAGTQVRIADPETGNPCAADQIGMIEVRGDSVFQGYWNMPEKTAEEMRDDGFFITGDLGIMDQAGRVSIVGRAKDLIISGGYNVYPKEVEDCLNQMDTINESAVFGIPDPDLGEYVVAAVVPVAGQRPTQATIAEYLAPALAKFKQPKHIYILDALPRNTMGKVQKNLLRQQYGA